MKKAIICAALALMVVLSMTGVAAAASGDQQTSSLPTEIEYIVPDSFSWQVPVELIVGTTVSTGNFGVTAMNVHTGCSGITISVESLYNGFVESGSDSAQYKLDLNGTEKPTQGILLAVTAPGSSDFGLQQLSAKWPDGAQPPTKAGAYVDTLTFTATVGS